MKKFFPLLFLATLLLPLRADIVANGDFSDGIAHWHGDGAGSSDPNSAEALLNAPSASASAGIVIHLQLTKWTRIYQTISTREALLGYSLTYKTSSDCVFTNDTTLNRAPVGTLIDSNLKSSIPLPTGSGAIVLVDMGKGTTSFDPISVKASTDPQTITGTIPKFTGPEEKTLLLTFPPGEGTITVQKVVLTPATN